MAPPSLLKALDGGALVLTPTALSASSLRALHECRQRSAGHTVWEPANILSWHQWLASLWSSLILNGHESRLLLNTAQEDLLWGEIVTPSLEAVNLASASGIATLARSAFGLACGYNVQTRLAAAAHTEDTEQFARWAAEFMRACGRYACLPAARLPMALREHLQRESFTVPAELHFTGFLDLSPADSDFLDDLRRAGTRIVEHPRSLAAPLTRLTLRAAGESEELRCVAHWLREFLDTHVRNPASDDRGPGSLHLPSVAVVLASPDADRGALDSIFREVLAPELNRVPAHSDSDPDLDPSSAPWESAAGQPLASQPIVATLIRLLRGLGSPLPLEDVTALLLSPYLGAGTDREAAAQFDAWWLHAHPPLRPELSLHDLHRLAQQSTFGLHAIRWLAPLLAELRDQGDLSAARTHAMWTSFVRQLSATVAWPGEQPLTSAEFAATEAWEHLLDNLATLDFTGRRVPFAEYLGTLEHHLHSATFRLPIHAPIRILPAAEAAIIPSDVVLLLQATEANWPPPVRPHPLLPWSLQVSAGMPGADPARDAARAERLTETLLSGAPHVLLSHAAESNEAPQRFAPMLAQTAAAPWRELSASDLLPSLRALITPELIVDEIPLPPLPSAQVAGGATVLQLQAACGFRAFAELRLRSTEPRAAGLGIDAGRAGSLLHQALDIFWQRVTSQAALLALPETDCDEHLMEAIRQAFARVPSLAHPGDPWDRAYRALQMQRLFDLLKEWLAFERNRAPFTVLDREQERHLTVGPVELQLRVDRVDSVASDVSLQNSPGTVLVDYKTGLETRISAWEGDRPDQPQLPLYTLLPHSAELRGLAFARIRRGGVAWVGLQSQPGLLGNARLEPDLDSLVSQWREVLTRLAEQFAAGDHSVNPKSYPTTCMHCGQRLLCRVDPAVLMAAAADEDGEPERIEEFEGAEERARG